MPFDPLRLREIGKRWVSLACCGVIAGLLALFVEPVAHRVTQPLLARLESFDYIAWAAIPVLLFAICWPIGGGRWRGFFGIRKLLFYPPLWVAVVIGVATWTAATSFVQGTEYLQSVGNDILWLGQQLGTGWVLLAVALLGNAWWPDLKRIWSVSSSPQGPTGKPNCLNTIEDLRAWARNDSEIGTPDQDLFGHDPVARRMAKRLSSPGEAPTQALVGRVGSGKSTILSLVEHHLRRNTNIIFVRISAWPFESPEAAVRGILDSLIRELGRNVNVLSLRGLPEQYVAAVEKISAPLAATAGVVRQSREPHQIIGQISRIACAAGLRIVLCVEDLERFSGGTRLPEPVRAEREVERLGPVHALLYLLDRTPSICVIVSDVSLRSRFDVDKIARFVEEPPGLDTQLAWQVVAMAREHCLSGGIVDPASPPARAQLTLDSEGHRLAKRILAFREVETSVPNAITSLVRTPRALKAAVRLTLEVWESMPGEIDLDAVLVASALRVSRPALFEFVRDHIDFFRFGQTRVLTTSARADAPPIRQEFERKLQEESSQDAASIRKLLEYLFPFYAANEGLDPDGEQMARPQAFFSAGPIDYWRRYLQNTAVEPATSDQAALRSIHRWLDGEHSGLVERVTDESRSGQIRQFVWQFEAGALCRLLRDVVTHVKSTSAAQWPELRDAPGIATVFGMIQDRRPPADHLFEAVAGALEEVVRLNLPLAHEVCLYAGYTNGSAPLLSSQQKRQVAEILRAGLLCHVCNANGRASLARAINGESPWLIKLIVDVIQAAGLATLDGRPFEGWPEFANLLLDLAEWQPTLGVPICASFTVRPARAIEHALEEGAMKRVEEWVGTFDEGQGARLFDVERLYNALVGFEMPDELEPQMKAACTAAVDAAKAYFEAKNAERVAPHENDASGVQSSSSPL